jgi:hypothetical protein
MAKFVAFFSTICLVGLLIAIFNPQSHRRTFDSQAIVKEVRPLNDLATVKYSIEKVVGMKEEKSPVGEESILLLVRGTVIAGVNLASLNSNDVSMSSDGVARIRLMKPEIQAAYIDEKYTKVWDRRVTWWTPWVSPDLDLEHKARLQAIDDIKSEALQMGILAEAQRNVEVDLRSILQALGVQKTVIAFGT